MDEMTYLILISHGGFAKGLKDALEMFVGDSTDVVIAVGLMPGESANDFSKRFEKVAEKLSRDSRFILLADIVGGSPLTSVCKVLGSQNKMKNCIILGGMNFPMALKAFLIKDTADLSALKESILVDANDGIREFNINMNDLGEYDI